MNTGPDSASPGRTLLLVDDEMYFRRFIGELVRRNFPFKVVEARDGEEALAQFKQCAPEVVLLDINMPRMNGMDTLAALRAQSDHVTIVMLTSVSEEMIVEECAGLGASYFVRKDLPATEILAELQLALADLPAGSEIPPPPP